MTERVAVNLAARIAGIVVIATGMGGVDRALSNCN